MKEIKKAGRPRVEHKAKRRNLAFTDAEWNLLTDLGRAKWVRLKMNEELLRMGKVKNAK
jgi:hypothetical protein